MQTKYHQVTANAGDYAGDVEEAAELKAVDYNFHSLKDTGAYDEVMKPWENHGIGQNDEFAFSCCTDYEQTIFEDMSCCSCSALSSCLSCCSVKSCLSSMCCWCPAPTSKDATIKRMTTVYHKAGSDRLVIKLRTLQTVMKAQGVKASCLLKLCCFPFWPWACCVGQEAHDTLDIVTQSIPIQSIFFVERNVTQKGDVAKPEGCCASMCMPCASCCFYQVPDMANYSQISIGYNRSNESEMMKNDEGGLLSGLKEKTQDYITLTLDANQSFNLHRYLNDILDKTAPREDVVVDSGLPR